MFGGEKRECRLWVQKRAYKLTQWTDATDFLDQVARTSGKLTRGGEADINTAARMVLLDWQRGRLPSFRLPPGFDADKEAAAATAAAAEAAAAAAPAAAAAAPAAAAAAAADAADADDEDAAEEEGALGEEVQRMAALASAAADEQCAGAIPVRGEFFDAEDLGGSGAIEELQGSEDEVSEDEISSGGSEQAGGPVTDDADLDNDDDDSAESGGSGAEDEARDDGEGGYGEEGLGWEAVLGDVLGQVCATC